MVKTIKLDNDHRIYLFSKKLVYKERKNGKLITRFVGLSIGDLLESSVIGEDVKEKLRKMLKDSNHFFNRG